MNPLSLLRCLPRSVWGWLFTLVSAGPLVAGGFALYPRSQEVFNPRLPAVPPVAEGGTGLSMAVNTRFVYELAPFVAFDGSGRLEVLLRDSPRRERKQAVVLADGGTEVTLGFERAADGRIPFLSVSAGGKPLGRVVLGEPWGEAWKPVGLAWTERTLAVTVDGREAGSLALPGAFSPARVELESRHVDELAIEGKGRFQLGWADGYAASVEPAESCEAVQARLMGFDTYAVSDRPGERDFPMIQVLNGGAIPRDVSFDFSLRSEITGVRREWTQPVHAGGRATTMAALAFPSPLVSDVYHLKVRTRGLSREMAAEEHFFFVKQRDEPAGPAKFGLHDSSNRTFGSWPDALGIDFAHVYAYWSSIVGPAWVRDFNGGYGLDPKTDPAEWAWNPRIDWILGQGLTPYVSLQSEPFLAWMRERTYPGHKLKHYAWGERGGFPRLDLYREFVRALAERYKGRVRNYEVENEPNSHAGGIPPEDYVKIVRAVSEEVHAVDAHARVFGICGTGDLVPWMTRVFADGGAGFMDGVSIHTYVTPQLPEQANLPGKLAEIRALIDKTGRRMPLVNSETGTYVALREQVDRPIPDARLHELIEAGTPTLSVARGWPNYALSERTGSLSIVRNAVYNFLAGAERFVFFGWNPQWPSPDWMSAQSSASGEGGFALISATKDGVRTPSWQTLAVGVLVAQLKGAVVKGARPVDQGGVLGGVFPKENGGEVGVLWSSMGTRSILLESADPDLEIVSLFGQPRFSHAAVGADGRALHSIDLTEEPVYVHVKRPGIEVLPSPVINVRQVPRDDGGSRIEFTLVNRAKKPWSDRVEFAPQQGWRFMPSVLDFALKPGGRSRLVVDAVAPASGGRPVTTMEGRTRLPDGSPFGFPVGLAAKPVVALAALPDEVGAEVFDRLAMPGVRLRLDRPEQVVVGRSPQLASLQEERYWQGPAELSGEVKIGRNARGIYVYINVTDSRPRVPEPWPGVLGSAVELFFDFREPGSGFGGGFGPGAYQVVLKPSLKAGEPVEIWNASSAHGVLAGTSASGARSRNGYWVMFAIPWKAAGRAPEDRTPFGFDVGIDGPAPAGGGRKSQIMLFGTAANNTSAAGYGLAITPPK